jgi:hypothetical protein
MLPTRFADTEGTYNVWTWGPLGGAEAKRLWDGVSFVNHGYYVEGTTYNDTTKPDIITATGVQTITCSPASNQPIYDLSGRRVTNSPLSRGIYISNGRKFVIK